jgi:hypothetical protein
VEDMMENMEKFVLYASNKLKTVPLFIVAIPSSIYEFYCSNQFDNISQGEALMEYLKSQFKKHSIFLPIGYDFFLNTFSVAILSGVDIDILPLVIL